MSLTNVFESDFFDFITRLLPMAAELLLLATSWVI
jgi:hypothetical protein